MNFSEALKKIRDNLKQCMFSQSTLSSIRWFPRAEAFMIAQPNEKAWYQHYPKTTEMLAEDWQIFDCPAKWRNDPTEEVPV